MSIKSLLIAIFTLLVLTFSSGSISIISNEAEAADVTANSALSDYTYERVLIDGIWWIYVYDEGELIAAYPEED